MFRCVGVPFPFRLRALLLATNPGLADGPDIMLYSDPAQADVEFKFDMHIDAIAAIFGTGGRTITTIRQQTNCRIRLLPPGSDPDRRVFELSGGQEATIQAQSVALGSHTTPTAQCVHSALNAADRCVHCACATGR